MDKQQGTDEANGRPWAFWTSSARNLNSTSMQVQGRLSELLQLERLYMTLRAPPARISFQITPRAMHVCNQICLDTSRVSEPHDGPSVAPRSADIITLYLSPATTARLMMWFILPF